MYLRVPSVSLGQNVYDVKESRTKASWEGKGEGVRRYEAMSHRGLLKQGGLQQK